MRNRDRVGGWETERERERERQRDRERDRERERERETGRQRETFIRKGAPLKIEVITGRRSHWTVCARACACRA